MKGPRPCLGHLGKGDWPLSTRAYPHRDTHLLTYTCWHTCNRPSTNSAASSSLSLLFALFLPPPLPSLDRRSPIPESQSSLSRYEPHLCALYPPPPAFSHVYRTRYILLTLLDFSGNSLLLFYDFTRADGLNNTGEAVLLSFG